VLVQLLACDVSLPNLNSARPTVCFNGRQLLSFSTADNKNHCHSSNICKHSHGCCPHCCRKCGGSSHGCWIKHSVAPQALHLFPQQSPYCKRRFTNNLWSSPTREQCQFHQVGLTSSPTSSPHHHSTTDEWRKEMEGAINRIFSSFFF